MHRFTVSLAVVVVLLVGVLATMGRSTTAQEGTSAAMAEHPIVGGWQWDNDPDNPGTDITYALFHADGTYVEINTDGVTDVGVWEPTGERTANLTFFFADLDADPEVTVRGEGRLAAEVDETGNAITGPFTLVVRDAEGTVVFSGEFLALGTRLEVMPMVPLGTPVAGDQTAATPTS